jgi:hypothetical protein
MTNHYLVDALNNGLTRILKDIANTYENVDFKDLSEKYLVRASLKKPKRKGHVSAYNIFVRETRPSIVTENPNLSFAEIAAHVSRRWADAKKDKKHMADLDRKKLEYVQKGAVAKVAAVAEAVVDVAEPVKQAKKKAVRRKKA